MELSSGELDRREFGKLLLASIGMAAGAPACSSSSDYTDADEAALERQKRAEAGQSGRGPHGPLRFRGYRGLAELPYFELDPGGQLRLTADDVPPAIDIHAHLGVALLFAPSIDLLRRTDRTQHMLDCDGSDPGCELDLDVYINTNFTPEMLRQLSRRLRNQLLLGNPAAETQTIPNLLAEMEAMNVERTAILPIAAGLPFGDDLTEEWMSAIERSEAGNRLIPFASVHPRDDAWREKLRGFAARGARGVKLHPEMQRLFPDDPAAMEIYAECESLGLPVIFHAGRSGIEPGFMRKYALIRRYVPAIESFPRVQFILGHAGARDVADVIPVTKRNRNVSLEISSQGVTQLLELLQELGPERLLFGTDWPFYHIGAPLTKVLLISEGRPEARAMILRGNAERLLGKRIHSAGKVECLGA
jgi:predicted TIM-barrel fold metal-dependent hydrolase